MEAICKEIMEALNEEIFSGAGNFETQGEDKFSYSDPDSGSSVIGIITEVLDFNVILM